MEDLTGVRFNYIVNGKIQRATVDMYDPEIGITATSTNTYGRKKIVLCFVLPGSPKFIYQEEAWQNDSQECVDHIVDNILQHGEVQVDKLYRIQRKYTNRYVGDGSAPDQDMCAFS